MRKEEHIRVSNQPMVAEQISNNRVIVESKHRAQKPVFHWHQDNVPRDVHHSRDTSRRRAKGKDSWMDRTCLTRACILNWR